MFSKSVIDSDMFLDMPLSAQALYFHLSMRADDDGFVNNPKKIQRIVGASDDDCKILIAKKFIIPFESGIVVIRHWKIHNYIQKDRYKETIYLDEKAQISIDRTGVYVSEPCPTCIQPVSKVDTQVSIGKGSIDKDSVQKNQADEKQGLENLVVESLGIETRSLPYNSILSTDELSTDNKSPYNPPKGERAATHRRAKVTDYDADGFAAFWEAYPKKAGKAAALKAWNKLAPDVVLQEQMGKALEVQKQSQQWRKDGGQFIPMPATWLNGRRWEDEVQTQTQPNLPTDADYVPLFDLGF